MKIAIAQIESLLGDIAGNYQKHIRFIDQAILMGADAIFFPELSLVGYDTRVSPLLAMDSTDSFLNSFQIISNNNRLVIGVGIPLKSAEGIKITMAIFQPNQTLVFYSKQLLDPDEINSFVPGTKQIIIQMNGVSIVPAICYESTQLEHEAIAFQFNPNIYLASVINSERGIKHSFKYFPQLIKKYAVPVIMVNSIGLFDQSISVGESSVWSKNGILLGRLGKATEGMIVYNTITEETEIIDGMI